MSAVMDTETEGMLVFLFPTWWWFSRNGSGSQTLNKRDLRHPGRSSSVLESCRNIQREPILRVFQDIQACDGGTGVGVKR